MKDEAKEEAIRRFKLEQEMKDEAKEEAIIRFKLEQEMKDEAKHDQKIWNEAKYEVNRNSKISNDIEKLEADFLKTQQIMREIENTNE